MMARVAEEHPILLATDTVFGIAAVPGSAAADEVFALKSRPASSPLPWLVGSVADLGRYAACPPAYARRLADFFWPGALTLVVRASEEAAALGGLAADGTVALRMPDDASCLSLIDELGPLACTSANLHGEPAPAVLADLSEAFYMLDAPAPLPSACPGGLSSTIVDCTGQRPQILREGAISARTVLAVALLGDRLP